MKVKKVARHKLKNDLKHWLGLAIHDEIALIDSDLKDFAVSLALTARKGVTRRGGA